VVSSIFVVINFRNKLPWKIVYYCYWIIEWRGDILVPVDVR